MQLNLAILQEEIISRIMEQQRALHKFATQAKACAEEHKEAQKKGNITAEKIEKLSASLQATTAAKNELEDHEKTMELGYKIFTYIVNGGDLITLVHKAYPTDEEARIELLKRMVRAPKMAEKEREIRDLSRKVSEQKATVAKIKTVVVGIYNELKAKKEKTAEDISRYNTAKADFQNQRNELKKLQKEMVQLKENFSQFF